MVTNFQLIAYWVAKLYPAFYFTKARAKKILPQIEIETTTIISPKTMPENLKQTKKEYEATILHNIVASFVKGSFNNGRCTVTPASPKYFNIMIYDLIQSNTNHAQNPRSGTKCMKSGVKIELVGVTINIFFSPFDMQKYCYVG